MVGNGDTYRYRLRNLPGPSSGPSPFLELEGKVSNGSYSARRRQAVTALGAIAQEDIPMIAGNCCSAKQQD